MGVKVTLRFAGGVTQRVEAADRAARKDIGEVCLTDANETVPLEEAVLQGSGKVTVAGDDVEVSYATPYALVQHEDESLNHQGQGRARWLELTVYERQGEYAAFYAEKVRRATGG